MNYAVTTPPSGYMPVTDEVTCGIGIACTCSQHVDKGTEKLSLGMTVCSKHFRQRKFHDKGIHLSIKRRPQGYIIFVASTHPLYLSTPMYMKKNKKTKIGITAYVSQKYSHSGGRGWGGVTGFKFESSTTVYSKPTLFIQVKIFGDNLY